MIALRIGLATGLVGLLAACQQLLPIGSAPERTFTLEYAAPLSTPAAEAPVVFLSDPLMAEGLGGLTVTVSLDSGERTSLKNARWATDLGSLIRDYLDRALTEETDAQFVGEGSLDLKTRCRMQAKVWSFDFVPGDTPSKDRARVMIDFRIIDNLTGTQIERASGRAERSVTGNDPSDVVSALAGALQETTDVAAGLVSRHLDVCSNS